MRQAIAFGLLLASCQRNGVQEPAREQDAQARPPEPAPAPAPKTAPPPPADKPPQRQPELPPWPPTWAAVDTAWCTAEVTALDERACVVLPEERSRTLLIYLHGIVPPGFTSPMLDNFEKVVASAARKAGVVVLLPLGRQGLSRHRGWWGWPTGLPAYRKLAKELVADIDSKQKKLEAELGAPFERLYLAGSSAGAYFVALLALHGDFAADGFGVMSGGTFVPVKGLEALEPKPLYVGFGKHDSVAGSARALGLQLRQAGWPVEIAAHDTGHGAREVYVTEALAFFREQLEQPSGVVP